MTRIVEHAFRKAPEAERPTSPPPSYGVPRQGGSFVPWDHVMARLREARAYWLATSGPGGRPHVVPVWGVHVADDLYLEVGDPATAKSRHLAADPRVVVHLDDVDDVVLVHGDAAFVRPTGALAADLSTAFRAKYPGYLPGPDEWDAGTLVRIDPDTVLAWRDMPTATRWRFTR